MRRPVLCLLAVAASAVLISTPAGPARTAEWAWQIHDLGTLGGTNAGALALNDGGQVVGWSEIGSRRHAVLWENGAIRDLGSFGRRDSVAVAISRRGQVVCIAGRWDGSNWSGPLTAVLWDRGAVRTIARLQTPLSPSEVGSAVKINVRGDVIGTSSGERGFLWRGGKLVLLRSLRPGGAVGVKALNDHGQVVGWSETRTNDPSELPRHDAVLWQGGAVVDLGGVSAGQINNSGVIALTRAGERERWVLVKAGKALSHGLGGIVALNDAGQMVEARPCGDSATSCYTAIASGKHTDLKLKGIFDIALNTRGLILAFGLWHGAPHPYAYVWVGNKWIDLSLLLGSAKHYTWPRAINTAGQIVGTGFDVNGAERAVLWMPSTG